MSETHDDLAPLVPFADPAVDPGGGFDVVMRGYDRRQVDATLASLHERLAALDAMLAAEHAARQRRDAELAELRSDLMQARQAALPEPPTFEGLGERVGQILALARDEAQEMLREAQASVAPRRVAAEEDVARLRAEAEAEAERLVAQGRQRLAEAELAAETATRRAESEALAVRAQAHKEADEVRAETRDEAEQALTNASREAGDLRRSAREEVDRLAAQRDEVRADLTRLRDALGLAVGGAKDDAAPPAPPVEEASDPAATRVQPAVDRGGDPEARA